MSITINVLIATIGRQRLQHMINSLNSQLTENDCLTIVFDGHKSIPKFDLSKIKAKVFQYYEPDALKYWGHGIRNKYASLLEKTDFVMHADDDDIYSPDAFQFIRKNINNLNTLYIYKLKRGSDISPPNNTLPFKVGSIGTPCGIIPYELNKKGIWAYRYGGDGLFYISIEKYAIDIKFINYIIYNVRPYENKQNNKNRNMLIKLGLIGKR